ncbi:MAG: hypothetical protein K2W82_04205 [Candidatus Obscuribacterales bacterium]|nr:hypothetical protein [Candidatus Obscuribacterales bacterium]
MNKFFSVPLLIVLTFICLLSGASAENRTNMRGERYGEVLLGKGGLLLPSEFDVYNTIGLNDCPESLWSKLDPEKIKQETGAKVVELNGPRYWTIDGLVNSSLVNTAKRSFGGIEMRLAAVVKPSIQDKISLKKPYVIHQVARDTTWLFKAGKPVYQLIDPDGLVYFMQSYSVQKKKQNASNLAQLASQLSLPKGWKFQTMNLKEDFALKAENGLAYVTQDNFANTYQRSSLKVDK